MLNSEQIKKLQNLFTSSPKKITVTSHKSPDGDAVGSSLGMALFLKHFGHTVSVILPDSFPSFLNFLPESDQIIIHKDSTTQAEEVIAESEILFCLDYNTLSRLGNVAPFIQKSEAVKIMIDHHQQPDSFPDYLISDTAASSTAQLVYDFITDLGFENKIGKTIGSSLYVGIVTDTGSFRFPCTSFRTHEIAGKIISLGVNTAQIHAEVYDNNTESKLKLLGYSLSEKLEVLPQYKTAIISLNKEEQDRFNYKKGDTEGLVNYALSVEGVCFAIMMRQGEKEIRMSFRSKGSFSVNKFSRENFEGGGHNNAAGGVSYLTIDATIDKLKSLLPQYKNELIAS